MGRYILRRILLAIPIVIAVSFITFILVNMSSVDPAEASLNAQGYPVVTEEMIANEREALGLNDNFFVRFGRWVLNFARLDFGTSYSKKVPVRDLVFPALKNTLKLTCVTAVIIVLAAFILGVLCALVQGRFLDKLIRVLIVGIGSMPSFWVGMILIVYVSVKLDLLPTGGMEGAKSYILPVAVLALSYMKFHFRLIRNAMITNKTEGYVMYERACGLSERTVLRHIFKNSLQTAVSSICMAIPGLLAGSVVIENLFSWPGIGRLCVMAIGARDIPLVQAYIVVVAMAFVLFNIVGDIIVALLNPKLRGD